MSGELISVGGSEIPEQPIAPPTEGKNRPEWLPEKFSNEQELAKAYAELEKRMSGKAVTEPPKVETPTPPPVKDAGDFAKFTQEFSEKGELSENSYKELASKGIPKDLVDAFIAGQKAQTQTVQNKFFEMAGGQEAYNGMVTWAAENFSEGEISAYNKAMASGDEAQITFAINGLKARYSSNAAPQRNVYGNQASQQGLKPFSSHQSMVLAMKDPRYNSDPDYRQEVMERVRISRI